MWERGTKVPKLSKKTWQMWQALTHESYWPNQSEVQGEVNEIIWNVRPIDPIFGDKLTVEACPTLDEYDNFQTEVEQ